MMRRPYGMESPETPTADSPIVEPQPLGAPIDHASHILWEDFMEGRRLEDVYALWKDKRVVNPGIRQRAITVLTAPDWAPLPYSHPRSGIERTGGLEEVIEGVPTQSLRTRLASQPHLAHEYAAGILYWARQAHPQRPGALLRVHSPYARAIQEILPLVQGPLADELCALFIAHAPELHGDMEPSPGSIRLFIQDDAIAEPHRQAGLDAWMTVLDDELQRYAVRDVRVERHALRPLAAFIEDAVRARSLTDGLLAKAVGYMEWMVPPSHVYVRPYNVTAIAWAITNNDLRYAFAWRHLQPQPSPDATFQVRTHADLALSQWVAVKTIQQGSDAFNARAGQLLEGYRQYLHELRLKTIRDAVLWRRLCGEAIAGEG